VRFGRCSMDKRKRATEYVVTMRERVTVKVKEKRGERWMGHGADIYAFALFRRSKALRGSCQKSNPCLERDCLC